MNTLNKMREDWNNPLDAKRKELNKKIVIKKYKVTLNIKEAYKIIVMAKDGEHAEEIALTQHLQGFSEQMEDEMKLTVEEQ